MAARDTVRGRLDWGLVFAVVGLLGIGTLAILSASWYLAISQQILYRHFSALVIGALAFVFGMGLNYQVYEDQWQSAYAAAIALLVFVLVVGHTVKGSRGWVRLPFFSFQPLEIARVLTLFAVAEFLVRRQSRIEELATLFGCLALAAPIMGLILLERNLSAILVLFPTLLFMLFCAGARIGQLLALAVAGGLGILLPLLWTWLSLKPERTAAGLGAFVYSLSHFSVNLVFAVVVIALVVAAFYWFSSQMLWQIPWYHFAAVFLVLAGGLSSGVMAERALKEYQRRRFISFVSPEADPLGVGYNSRQSVIALGSGGLWGKGMFSGTQGRLGFLPERHTDFIFAVVGEEMGFLGALLTLALYLFVLWRLVAAARGARDEFGYLLACGIVGLFASQLLINTGMAVGLLPVAGVPLPLVSYGGSSLVVSLWAIGIAQSIYIRRSGTMSGSQMLT